MTAALLSHADRLLRATDRFATDSSPRRDHRILLALMVAFAPCYGALMGSYHFDSPERVLQVLYSAVKLPLLLFATSLVCLPGFFVLNSVLGLRDDFIESLQAILAGQACLSIVLAALAPPIRFLYFCDISYRAALLWSTAALALATIAAHSVMRRYYRVLIARRPHHRLALAAWLVLYAFVGIQMAWTLRPFIGAPGMHVSFFRQEPFSNAYVVVWSLIFR